PMFTVLTAPNRHGALRDRSLSMRYPGSRPPSRSTLSPMTQTWDPAPCMVRRERAEKSNYFALMPFPPTFSRPGEFPPSCTNAFSSNKRAVVLRSHGSRFVEWLAGEGGEGAEKKKALRRPERRDQCVRRKESHQEV